MPSIDCRYVVASNRNEVWFLPIIAALTVECSAFVLRFFGNSNFIECAETAGLFDVS